MSSTPSKRSRMAKKSSATKLANINLNLGKENDTTTTNDVSKSFCFSYQSSSFLFDKKNFISKMSAEYEAGGLTPSNIENMQINSL